MEPEERAIVQRHPQERQSYPKIGRELGLSRRTVRRRYRQARERLRGETELPPTSRAGSAAELLDVLKRITPPKRRLPGQAQIVRAAGITQTE